NPRLQPQLLHSGAAAVVLTPAVFETLEAGSYSFIPVLCSEPYLMYALLAQWFDRHRLNNLPSGIHESAIIAPTAQIGEGVSIGPHCVIEDGVHIGKGTRLGPGCI